MEVQFNRPAAVAVRSDGAIFVTDHKNHRIRMIYDGQVTTFAGNGIAGHVDGPAAEARFQDPTGIVVGPDGTVYVSECSSHRIRMICDGQVTTIAGNGSAGYKDGPALQAEFFSPVGLAVSPDDGTIYVADQLNNLIRMIQDGQVTTFAGDTNSGFRNGPAAEARFHTPTGLALGPDGTLYIVERDNHLIRMISNGQVTTLAGCRTQGLQDSIMFDGIKAAGFSDGPVLEAKFFRPIGAALSPDGAIYVADCHNHAVRVIRDGYVSTLVGGLEGFADGPLAEAKFHFICSIAAGPDGAVIVADNFNQRIRIIQNDLVSTLAGNGTEGFADGPALTHIPPFEPSSSADDDPSFFKSLDAATDMTARIGDTVIKLHRSFITLRCPSLLDSEALSMLQAVDSKSVALFHKFLYTDRLPQKESNLTHLLGLALLLFHAGMKSAAATVLSRLERFPFRLQELVRAYSYCLDLAPFDEGHNGVLNLLRKRAAQLQSHTSSVPEWLDKHADKTDQLLQELMKPLDESEPPTTSAVTENTDNILSVSETLNVLFRERHTTGDFEIAIRGDENKVEKVHSYVMYAMWPYFCHMYDAGMKEKHERRLELPGAGEDGGMALDVFDLIIELCYKPDLLAEGDCSDRVNASLATAILPIAQMYLGDDEHPEEIKPGAFSTLVELAQGKVGLDG